MTKILRSNKNFSDETRQLFQGNNECWFCGENGWDCGHHILGGNFKEADSPLNLAPLHNATCHIGGGHHFSDTQTVKFLVKTLKFLIYNHGTHIITQEREMFFISQNMDKYEKTEEGRKLIKNYINKDVTKIEKYYSK